MVAWFTMAGDMPRIRFAESSDGGENFGKPTDIDAESPLGRVGVTLLENGDGVVTWMRQADAGQEQLMISRVTAAGASEPQRIAAPGGGRPAGIPQVVSAGTQVILAFTHTLNDTTRVRTVRVPLPEVEDLAVSRLAEDR